LIGSSLELMNLKIVWIILNHVRFHKFPNQTFSENFTRNLKTFQNPQN
jgi:hypothetical protein